MKFTPVEPQVLIDEHLQECKDALLFVGMGIGKTAAVLNRLNELFLSAESFAALIVAPMRVANLTWPMEVREWDQFNWMKVANLRTESGQRHFLNGTAHLYTINYDAMTLLTSLVERRKAKLPYDVVIFDELTRAKNPSSKRINTYRRKVPRVERHWGLTGTPIPNRYLDLFAQVRLVDGGERLGSNYLHFKRTYFFGSEVGHQPWRAKEGATGQIEEKISDITLTLKTSDWLDLPDIVFEDVEVVFPDDLMKRYRNFEETLVIELKENNVVNVANAAALVTKLLQFTSGYMYDENKEAHHIHDLKISALKKIAKEEDNPLLVATIFKHEQARVRTQMPQARFFADAKTPESQERLMADWNARKVALLAAHPGSVGHGLNLQYGSSSMVWMTLTYNREFYDQMIHRLHRRGQTNLVKVYRLIVPGTVDEAVVEALAEKAENEARLMATLQMLESFRKRGGSAPVLTNNTDLSKY